MRKYKANLSTSSIDGLIKELTAYKDGLQDKTKLFVDALLEKGIVRAEEVKGVGGRYGTHKMENYVTFTKRLDVKKYGCHGVMLGMGKTIHAKWFGIDGDERNGDLSSIAAIEFGTAGLALPAHEAFGVTAGQGTNAKYGHEGDLDWYFIIGCELQPS